MVDHDYNKSVLHNVSVSGTNEKIQNTLQMYHRYRYKIPVENVSRYKIHDTFYVSKIHI